MKIPIKREQIELVRNLPSVSNLCKVYHGSYMTIDNIDLSFSRVGKDFGRGFYVTNLRSQAEYWAKKIGKKKRNNGFVTEFEYDDNIVKIMKMNVLSFDAYTENWLDFVILNRANLTEQQAHNYDIIEGNVADDEVAARVFDYQNGKVSKADFLKELEYKPPNHQLCFCTVQSLQALVPTNNDVNVKIIHIDNEIIKSLVQDFNINELKALSIYYKSQTYTQLSDETTKFYQKPWQEIYEMLKKEL
ncbi:hypothetical protein FACS189429_4690 [Bacteroidia bacterium]|nr:hypothetical protein FACS189429_4690 [Bacteroidia bacterium]GHV43807.1 hypothetical protein FACS1894180_4010 [Bacteroidia bacterium]